MSAAAVLFALIIIAVIAAAVALGLQMREKSRQEIVERTLGVTSNAEVRRAIRRGLGAEGQAAPFTRARAYGRTAGSSVAIARSLRSSTRDSSEGGSAPITAA